MIQAVFFTLLFLSLFFSWIWEISVQQLEAGVGISLVFALPSLISLFETGYCMP